MKPSQNAYVPSHPTLFLVEFLPGDFSSSLKAQRPFEAGERITPLEGLTRRSKAYTSVQCGPGPMEHVELNSDLVYVNHSCNPNVAFDLSSPNPSDWHVRALSRISPGTTLTFFYPSTEWDMDQPFECQCDSANCLRRIQGARYLTKEALISSGYINVWILDLVAKRDVWVARADAGKVCVECGFGLSARGDLSLCGCRPNSIPSF